MPTEEERHQLDLTSKEMGAMGTFVWMFTQLEAFVDIALHTHLSGMEEEKSIVMVHELSGKMDFADRLSLLGELVRMDRVPEEVELMKSIRSKVETLSTFRNKLLHKTRLGMGRQAEPWIPVLTRDTQSATQNKVLQQEGVTAQDILDQAKKVAVVVESLKGYVEVHTDKTA